MNPLKTTGKVGKTVKKKSGPSSGTDGSSSEGLCGDEGPTKSSIQSEDVPSKFKPSAKMAEWSPSSPKLFKSRFQPTAATSSPISKRIASVMAKFETPKPDLDKELTSEAQSSDPDIFGFPKHFKLPFCLKGLGPCQCEPLCKVPSPEVSQRPPKIKLPVRSSSNSPPVRKRFSDVRDFFENAGKPSTPVSPGRQDRLDVNIRDILKDLKEIKELAEPYAAFKIKELQARFEDCISPKPKGSPRRVVPKDPERERFISTRKPESSEKLINIELGDLHEKGDFKYSEVKPESSTSENETVLSLTDLYKKANLPYGEQPSEPKISVNSEASLSPVTSRPSRASFRENFGDASSTTRDYPPLFISVVQEPADLNQEPGPSNNDQLESPVKPASFWKRFVTIESCKTPNIKISKLPSSASSTSLEDSSMSSTYQIERPKSALKSSSINYLDLSSYVTSEPKSLVASDDSHDSKCHISNQAESDTEMLNREDLIEIGKKQGAIPKRGFKTKKSRSKSKKRSPARRAATVSLPKEPENRTVPQFKFDVAMIAKALKEIEIQEKSDKFILIAKRNSERLAPQKSKNSEPRKPLTFTDRQIILALRYYPGLPDYTQRPTCRTPAITCDVSSPEFSFVPTDPEVIAEMSKIGETPPNYIPTRSFESPQSGAMFCVEEWDSKESEFSKLLDYEEELGIDDGLDAIFGPLVEDEEFYDAAEMVEEEFEPSFPLFDLHDFDLGQGGGADSPDLEFVYDDADTHGNEIAELYSYTEQPELQLNVKAFEDQMESYALLPNWQRLSVENRKSVVMKLLDQLESSIKPLRMRSARCLLYIAQGCWAEVQSDTEQQHWTRINSMMLFQLGAFSAFTDLLNIEIDNSTAAHVAMRKIAVSLADSQDLRVILSVLYIITEVIRNEKSSGDPEYRDDIEAFVFEIGNAYGEDHLIIKLLSMVTKFCSGAAPHFPMKKVLLLLWKLTLVSLGGMNELKEMKAKKRSDFGLPPQDEDTLEIIKTMRSSSPPASATDLLEVQNQKRSTRPFRRSLIKQSSLDDQESLGLEVENSMSNENGDELADMTAYDERRPTDNNETNQMFNNHILNMYNMQVSPPPQHDIIPRGLPWKPKVRQKDIDAFLDTARLKFLGFSLSGDQTTLFGLPEPIHEGVRVLREHVYTSLVELQIQKEEEIARNPVSSEEEEIELTPTEILYQAMLPSLPQYMIALLKILLAAAPTSKAKTDSINIMADVLPEEMPMTVLQSMKLGIDVNRHKEIIVKAVSAILLLFLKHFKLNHIYQFEFMSQHLVFANCIPLVLKFFNQNIMGYVGAKNAIPILDFPSCVIGDQPDLTAESLEIGDAAQFSWRNMFSCINLLRILNKLTKWKHSRIMMVVVFKSAPILKRTLKVRHAMTQLYVLKLLKMQTKYLGRQWRKSNMKTISAIYQKVRHRLNDDWAYGNDLDARPWDFQNEECALRASVDRFNNRRYTQIKKSDFEPVDNNPNSILGQPYDLSESFKRHYNLWLEQEVHGTPIDWDKLLFEEDKRD